MLLYPSGTSWGRLPKPDPDDILALHTSKENSKDLLVERATKAERTELMGKKQ
jgi:hypothetical protein